MIECSVLKQNSCAAQFRIPWYNFKHADFRSGDIVTHWSVTVVAVAIAAIASMAASAPCLAKSHEHARYKAPRAVVVVNPSTVPQLIAIGPNGYWVTTTWGCWVDDGQWRIHDRNAGGS